MYIVEKRITKKFGGISSSRTARVIMIARMGNMTNWIRTAMFLRVSFNCFLIIVMMFFIIRSTSFLLKSKILF